MIPKLEPPRDGKEVEEIEQTLKSGGRMIKHWVLRVRN
jgi:hypothetical protein